jgi:N-acetylglucosamine malate deacetylase 1
MTTLDSFKNKRIMVVVAHPDDELLGLGATLHALVHRFGATIHVVILGEGITSRADQRQTEKWANELSQHQQNIRDAQQKIGYQTLSFHQFPDNRFDSIDLLSIIKVIEKEKQAFQPEIIFTHHGGDVNIDHQRTFEAVNTACRPMQHETVRTLICFETPSGTEWIPSSDPRQFIPNLFIGVTELDVQAKIDAMQCYTFEKREFPHPRSPEALRIRAQYWGVVNGCNFAEPFRIIRSILS